MQCNSPPRRTRVRVKRHRRDTISDDARELQHLRWRRGLARADGRLRGSRLGALAVPRTLGGDDRVLRLVSCI